METKDNTPTALLDVATNLLAILLIVTLFALPALVQRQQGVSQLPVTAVSPLRFIAPQRELFPPFSRFYLVIAGRIVPWDQEAVIAALAQDPERPTGRTHQGQFIWIAEPLVTRDIDTFQLRFLPDPEAIAAQTPPWRAEETDHLLAELKGAAGERIYPVFIVYPDGMDLFAGLYDQLHQAGLRFRWFAHAADEPILIGRMPAQFTHYGIYW